MCYQPPERAFETSGKEILLTRRGWTSGPNAELDKDRSFFPAQVFAFINNRRQKYWAKVESVVERLQEYRTALVTAAVTGKIDVGAAKG